MILFPNALRQLLLSVPALTVVVQDRIYNTELPMGLQYPALCFWCLKDDMQQYIDGTTSRGTTQIWRLDLWGLSAEDVELMRLAIRDNILGYKGDIVIGSESLHIQSVIFMDGRSVQYTGETKIYGWELDFEFSYY